MGPMGLMRLMGLIGLMGPMGLVDLWGLWDNLLSSKQKMRENGFLYGEIFVPLREIN